MRISFLSFTLLLSVLPFSAFAADNTELLSKEPTQAEPKFERKIFNSCSELESTMSGILSGRSQYSGWEYTRLNDMAVTAVPQALSVEKASSITTTVPSSTPGPHSKTNTQVIGIDESDTVKNDGKYLYLSSVGDRAVIILDAKTLSKVGTIRIPQTYTDVSLYVQRDTLVITATRSDTYNARWGYWYNPSQKTIVATYNIANRATPRLVRFLQLEGSLQDSRLSDDGWFTAVATTSYWYPPIYRGVDVRQATAQSQKSLIASNFLPRLMSRITLDGKTQVQMNGLVSDCRGIEYILPDAKTLASGNFDPSLTTILRFNITTPSAKPTTKVILSQAGQIHLSRSSLYLASDFSYTTPGTSCPPGAMCKMIPPMTRSMTLVHRFALAWTEVNYVYTKTLEGSPLNQYAMDENDRGEFRIVTQNYAWTSTDNKNSTTLSIIANNGDRLGSISGIAPGENFQSARFIGSRLYLVTFQQIDPLFVIDVADGKNPKILGELKIPGYSTYLHPYDRDRLIGLGYDTFTNKNGGTQNGGIKVDLYNVSDVKNPKQERSLVIGDIGSSSEATYNPRTFTWYKEKNLLLLPGTFTTSARDPNDVYRLARNFQWLVGVSITPQSISEQFRVTHIEKPATAEADWKKECSQYSTQAKTCQKLWDGTESCNTNTYIPNYCLAGATVDTYLATKLYEQSENFITRPLYVGDMLYTLSESKIRLWNLMSPTNFLGEFVFKKAPPPVYTIMNVVR